MYFWLNSTIIDNSAHANSPSSDSNSPSSDSNSPSSDTKSPVKKKKKFKNPKIFWLLVFNFLDYRHLSQIKGCFQRVATKHSKKKDLFAKIDFFWSLKTTFTS